MSESALAGPTSDMQQQTQSRHVAHATSDTRLKLWKESNRQTQILLSPFYLIDSSPRQLLRYADDEIHENKAFVGPDIVKSIG